VTSGDYLAALRVAGSIKRSHESTGVVHHVNWKFVTKNRGFATFATSRGVPQNALVSFSRFRAVLPITNSERNERNPLIVIQWASSIDAAFHAALRMLRSCRACRERLETLHSARLDTLHAPPRAGRFHWRPIVRPSFGLPVSRSAMSTALVLPASLPDELAGLTA
jgi:hypothetical protein